MTPAVKHAENGQELRKRVAEILTTNNLIVVSLYQQTREVVNESSS